MKVTVRKCDTCQKKAAIVTVKPLPGFSLPKETRDFVCVDTCADCLEASHGKKVSYETKAPREAKATAKPATAKAKA